MERIHLDILLETIVLRLEAITTRLEVIALRLEAITTRLEAIALRLEAIATRFEAIALSQATVHLHISEVTAILVPDVDRDTFEVPCLPFV